MVARAFAPMPFSEGDEQDLVDALQRAKNKADPAHYQAISDVQQQKKRYLE